MKNKKKKIVLLDSHAILHRAYHALPDFASSKGEPTGALYGLVTMLLRIVEEFEPDYVVACFDLPKPTYRHEAYEGYKSGRKKTDDELVSQIIRAHDVVRAFSIPEYSLEGFEADDMLGTIVEKMKNEKDLEIVIASGDMDTLQLVDNEHIKVFTLRKGIKDTILYGEKEIVERFGFEPKFLPDYKGLRGDTSDNIPGIKGIGEKTATELIREFGHIEDMYSALQKGEERFKKLKITERVLNLLREGKEEAEFSKMLGTIRRDAPIDFKLPEKTLRESVSVSTVKDMLRELDFRSLPARIDSVFGGSPESEEKEEKKDEVLLPEEEIEKLKVAVWLLNSSLTSPSIDDVLSFGKGNIEKAKEEIEKEIERKGLSFVWNEIEIPIITIAKEMQKEGILVDKKYLENLSKEYHKKAEALEAEIYKLSGEEFNISSPKQLGVILFEKLGLKVKGMKKTAGGASSTKESELQKIAHLHPVIQKILEYRELQKLLGTYIDNMSLLLDTEGRLHARFVQTGTTTGRMSSEDPNLQNIPVKSDLGRAIRGAFIAPKGKKLLAFDYSQIELRIAAILSDDPKMIQIFKRGEDVHSAVASEVNKVPISEVTKEMRRKAKVINFGILYGMGVNALRQNLESTKEEAENFLNEYFETFTVLRDYIDNAKREAAKNGYTVTLFGRRRYFEGFSSKLPFIRAAAERMAVNAPIQGTEGDLTKLAMVHIDRFLQEKGLKDKVKLLLQIHDELVFEADEEVVEEVVPEIERIMKNVLPEEKAKGVPIEVHVSEGQSLIELK